MYKLWTTFIDILFPPLCLSCKKHLKNDKLVICENCYKSIPVASSFYCSKCKKRSPTINGRVPACSCRNSFTIGAASTYSKGPIHDLIAALKYHGVTKAAEPLGKLMATFIELAKFDFSNFIIIPIPLSPLRLRERGYNQAELIAKEFLLSFPGYNQKLRTDIVKRIINSDPQTSMGSRDLRKDNIIGAFFVVNPTAIQEKRILLMDDVYTTGATTQEVAKMLKDAGAKRVIILTVARA